MAQVASSEVSLDIELLKDEAGGLMWEEGIATITFYKGDFTRQCEALRSQFDKVVAFNPWLAGRLVKTKEGSRLRHPSAPSASDIDALFKTASADDAAALKLKHTSPYTETCKQMYKSKKVIVGNGGATLGKNAPLTLLTMTESTPGEFSVVFSLSHVIADGRTYYEVLKMLQPGSEVRELSTKRVMSFSEKMKDNCGRKELEWIETVPAMCMWMCPILPTMCGCGKKAKCVAFHLDENRLARAKSEGAREGGVPYVSTNDILTSGFFNATNTRIGMMGMDCRNKIEGIGSDLAGNYVTALTMDPDTFATPATVRKMLSSKPYKTTGRPLPSCCKWFVGGEGKVNFSMVTNWSSFAGNLLQLEGCEMVIHLPVQNPAHCIFDLMIPFASGAGKFGVICWTISTDEDGLREALPVGERVSRELFP